MTRTQSSKWEEFQFMKGFINEKRELKVSPKGNGK